MTVPAVEKAGVKSRSSSARSGQRAVGGQQAELDRLGPDPLLVDAGAVVGDLEHDRAGDAAGADAHDGLGRLAGGGTGRGVLAAVVDGVDDEVLEGVGDAVQDLLVDLDVLAGGLQADGLAAAGGHVADDARQRGEGAAHRHHRQAHRAVADERHAAAVALDELAQAAHAAGQLVARADQAVQGELDVGRQGGAQRAGAQDGGPAGLLGREGQQAAGGLLDAPGAEVGLADGVQQLVHLAGGDPDAVAGGARGLDRGGHHGGLDDRRDGLGGHDGDHGAEHRYDDGVLAVDGRRERRHDRREVVVAELAAGQRPVDGVAGREQHVDEVAADGEAPVAQRAEQVLHRVADLQHAGQAEHPGGALDGVRVAEQAGDDLPRCGVALQLEQAGLQRGQPLLDLRAEGGEQLGVVPPGGHRPASRP